MILGRIIAALLGYVFGLFQTSYIYGKMKNIDIREHGSGNAGTTNALRTFGVFGAILTLAGDVCKSMLAMFITWLIFRENYPEGVKLLMMYAGLGAVLGHNYPFYLKFKGGKGIACTVGMILAFDIRMAPLLLFIFILTVAVTRYVSLGSILVVTFFYIELIFFGNMGLFYLAPNYLTECYLVGAIFTGLAIWQHRGNIVKLKNGNENKISFRK